MLALHGQIDTLSHKLQQKPSVARCNIFSGMMHLHYMALWMEDTCTVPRGLHVHTRLCAHHRLTVKLPMFSSQD